ncbi:hypothetical protein BS47DRAFT_1364570 [Hydnum rufescens UP504]|uniref:Uncharacterized protein n=1 Tax=Hydnum rufescens UP504 TaxID=1448309 RepID=A0A9P6AR04_9AGAM|nr:hypothetical protein BS47DRAFT_1364570 [Hydnum rufescens UP504]
MASTPTTNRLLLKGTKGFLLDQSHTGTSVDSPPTNITINEKQVWCNWVILWRCRSKRSWSHDQYSKGTDWSENVRDNYNAEFQTNPMSGRPCGMGTYLHVHTPVEQWGGNGFYQNFVHRILQVAVSNLKYQPNPICGRGWALICAFIVLYSNGK